MLNGERIKQDEMKSTNKVLETDDDCCGGVWDSCFEHNAEYMFDSLENFIKSCIIFENICKGWNKIMLSKCTICHFPMFEK